MIHWIEMLAQPYVEQVAYRHNQYAVTPTT